MAYKILAVLFTFAIASAGCNGCSGGGNSGGGDAPPGPSNPQGTPTPTPPPVQPTPTPISSGPFDPPGNPGASQGTYAPMREMGYYDKQEHFNVGCKTQGVYDHKPMIDPRLKVGLKELSEFKIAELGQTPMRMRDVTTISGVGSDYNAQKAVIVLAENFMGAQVGQKINRTCSIQINDKGEEEGVCQSDSSGSTNLNYMFLPNPLGKPTEYYELGTYTLPSGRKVTAVRITVLAAGFIVKAEGGGSQIEGYQATEILKTKEVVSFGFDSCGGTEVYNSIKAIGNKDQQVYQEFTSSHITDNPNVGG